MDRYVALDLGARPARWPVALCGEVDGPSSPRQHGLDGSRSLAGRLRARRWSLPWHRLMRDRAWSSVSARSGDNLAKGGDMVE